MIKWKLNLIFFPSFLLFYVSCNNENKDMIKEKKYHFFNYTIEPGKIKLKDLKIQSRVSYNFSEEIKDDLLANIYSPNCDIEINDKMDKDPGLLLSNENVLSLEIKKESLKTFNLTIKPTINLINNKYKYKNLKMCPLIINAIELKNSTLLYNKGYPIFLLFYKNLKQIILSYKINKIKENSSLTLSFSFNNASNFNIYIPYIINTTISNSTTIFLDSNSLKNIKENMLKITITYIGNKNSSLIFQIIKPNSAYLLQKNNLNKGFITSNYKYQYYYVKILEEEGEIMLHNKRHSGKLFGRIKNKEDTMANNTSEYLKYENDSELEFDEHSQKLSFNFTHTKNCSKGCYLFITYYNDNYNKKIPITGYEYTLLVRIWNVEDDSPQIINVPFNEYIFGTFNKDSFINHYYSIFIPQETEKIIIQIESNYIEGYIGKGKKKLITLKSKNTNLNITQKKMIIEFSKDKLNELDYLNDEISLAFRPQTFFSDIFSFYYFRISILKENDTNLIYPLDSNMENICIPERDKNKEDNHYYCYFLLKNSFNEFYNNFYVTTSNQNDIYKIYSFHNYEEKINSSTKYYIGDKNNKDLKLILFKFEFNDTDTKTILSTFSIKLSITYPQIYSSQIFYFSNNKAFIFNLKYNYLLIYNQIYGNGFAELDDSSFPKISSSNNFKGKSISIPTSEIHNITFYPNKELIFCLKLDYLIPKEKITEIKYGESMNKILLNINFPIFYYIKYSNQDNIDINFRILNIKDSNEPSDISINGYILNRNNLNRHKRGEFIELKEPIIGKYDKWSKNGFFQINNTIINKYFKENNSESRNSPNDNMEFVLIKIDGEHYTSFSMSIETIAISKVNQNYLIPINQYIISYFNSLNNTSYLFKNEKNINEEMIIEFSPNYEDIKLIFNESMKTSIQEMNSTTGVQKYKITNNSKDIILNVSTSHRTLDSNYLLRYYFINNSQEDEFEYKLDKHFIMNRHLEKEKDNYAFSFEFNKSEIYLNKKLIDGSEKDIKLQIYGFLFKEEKNNKEILNTSAIISSIPTDEDQIEVVYKNNTNFVLKFYNISKTYKKYTLQIKINIKINDYFFNEKFFVYSMPIDLSESLKVKLENFLIQNYIILIAILSLLIITLIFIILYCRIKKKNNNLKNELLSISFSSDKNEDDDILLEERNPTIRNSINPFV